MSHNLDKLECRKPGPGGIIEARCPACAREGLDKTGNHLSVRPNGEFNCVVGSKSDPSHNRFIRAFLKGDGSESDIEFIDSEPRLKMDKVYPDDILTKLVPDYSYWRGRGIGEEVVKPLENGIAPRDEKGPLSGRSIFPLRDLDGRILAWSGRLVIDSSFAAKWKHLGPVSRVVWPYKVSGPVIESTKTAVLIESPGDTLACLSSDIKPVICLFGLNLFDLIIATLIGAGVNRVFVSLNRDADARKGQAAALKVANKLTPFISDVQIRLPKAGKDWGECIKTEEGRADLAVFKGEIG